MKKNLISLVIALVFAGAVIPAHAQIPVTDAASIAIQTAASAKQVLQWVIQGKQLEAEIKNLLNNPASLLGADVGSLINGVGSIMSATNSIGGSFAQINKNFASTFKSPTAANLAASFTKWNQTSTSTLEGALKAAGMHRDAFATDEDALTAIYNKSQASGGNLQALQSLAEINAMQVQQTQKLGDLLAAQNIAASTYMASQTAKNEAKNQETEAIKAAAMATLPATPTTLDPSTQTYTKWNLYSPK